MNIEVTSFVAAGTGYLADCGRSEITSMDGNRGFMILTHRASAATTTVSYWADSRSLAARQDRLARIHHRVVGNSPLNIEHFDMAVSRRLRVPGSTAIALMTRLVCSPAGISRTVAFYRADVFAALEASRGLCSAELFLAGLTGNGSALTIWDNDDDATAAWRLFHQLATRAAETLGIEYFGLQVFDRVLGSSPSETEEW
jgi:heme-degrading monooxygenase HmoA